MLNKTEVSNLITGLRPKIKQSGIHLVHLLTREIKKMENRKGDKAEKFKKKAETFRKEAILVKKIEPDNVSRYAVMMNFSERQKLLNDVSKVSLPLETKVIVKMATHKNVVAHIENFRGVHTEWKDKLPDLLKNLGIFTQFKKKVEKQQEKSKRKLARKQALGEDSLADSSVLSNVTVEKENKSNIATKVQEKVTRKTPLFLKETAVESDDSDPESNKLEINDAGSDNIEDGSDHVDGESDLSDDENDHSDAENDHSDAETDQSDAETDQSDAETDQSDAENDNSEPETDLSGAESDNIEAIEYVAPKNEGKIKPPVKPKGPRISSASMFAEVRRFADLEQDKNVEKERKSNHDSASLPDEDLSGKEAVEEDTFFMTGENKFLKTIAVKREDGEGLQTKSAEKKSLSLWALDKDKQTGNRAERRAQMRGDFSKKAPRQMNSSKEFNKTNQFGKNFKNFDKVHQKSANGNSMDLGNQKKEFSKFGKKDFSKNKTNTQKEQSTAEKSLHPSWEAKRKQKVSLDCFQGKKMKFDD